MATTTEKIKKKEASSQDQEEGYLWRAAMKAKPQYKSNEEALAAFTKRLDLLAKKRGLTPEELFHKAEHATEFEEEYLEVIRLYSSINRPMKKK